MENFVTVMTFSNPSELIVLRSRLEADGIVCLVMDEMTTQVNPLYSNAIGGAKLQVRPSDVPRTIEILKDGGYINDRDLLHHQDSLTKLDHATNRIPFVNKLRVEFRLVVIVVVAVLTIFGVIYLATMTSTYDRLTKESWCVDQVTFNGERFTTKTNNLFRIDGMGFCQEQMVFQIDSTIELPGFETRAAIGKWTLRDDSLQISKADTFDFLYNGLYKIDISDNQLILKSTQTTIYCHIQKVHIDIP